MNNLTIIETINTKQNDKVNAINVIIEENNKIDVINIEENYRIININNNLISKNPNIIQLTNNNDYIRKLNYHQEYIYKENNILYHLDTSISENTHIFNNNFINSILNSYNNHQSIILSPDDLWVMILFYFSSYINKNSEILRKSFVLHENVKELIVKDINIPETEWNPFFINIKNEIIKNTHPGVVELFECNFTTSTQVHKIISTAIIMDSFKQFFTYTRVMTRCGIKKVKFMGTQDDWILLINKTLSLYSYVVDNSNNDDKLKIYLDNIIIILNKLLQTYNGEVDLDFWEKIINSEKEISRRSGQADILYIDGWLLHFYGIYDKTDIENVPSFTVSVPIKLFDEDTNITKELELITKWGSVSIVDENDEYYSKPDLNLYIVEKDSGIKNNNILGRLW